MPEIPDRHPRGPDENRAAAKALGYRGANSITVLASNNDPFYKGTPAHQRDAEWFLRLYQEFGYGTSVHLRRIHYRATITGNTSMADGGTIYENTDLHWGRMCAAASSARILGLVDVEAFDDRRNGPPTLNRRAAADDRLLIPRIGFYAAPWEMPSIDVDDLLDAVSIAVPTPYPAGYEYAIEDDHPTLVEVWIEKSTMNDILVPLCAAEHVNLAVGAGFESITHIVELVRRAEALERPAHIIYVSDFDPAGAGMPVAVGRQLQFWIDEFKVDQRITLETLVLTREQCVEFALPRTPIKDTDKRGRGFEARHGEGATELDALEALRPGELARIIRQAVRRHVDTGFRSRLATARADADRRIEDAWTEADGIDLQSEADRMTDEARESMAGLGDEVNRLLAEKVNELAPLREAAGELVRRAEALAAGIDVDLPDRPQAEIAGPPSDVLFDSDRHWVEQLEVFRAHQDGGGEDGE